MNSSNFGKINWRDVLHGFIVAFTTASLTGLVQSLEAGTLPNIQAVKTHVIIGLTAGISYLLKQILQNNNGQLLKKD